MKLHDEVQNYIEESIAVKKNVEFSMNSEIIKAAKIIIKSLKSGKKILICGNGGSAADAQHFASELIGRFEIERDSLRAVALTTDTSIISAVANDYNWNHVFSRQIDGLANKDDVLIAITTSGNSSNIVNALKTASQKGLKTICLAGKNGGKASADLKLIVPSQRTAHIQESHLMIIHIICMLIDDEFSANFR